jgi:hypothetical protein
MLLTALQMPCVYVEALLSSVQAAENGEAQPTKPSAKETARDAALRARDASRTLQALPSEVRSCSSRSVLHDSSWQCKVSYWALCQLVVRRAGSLDLGGTRAGLRVGGCPPKGCRIAWYPRRRPGHTSLVEFDRRVPVSRMLAPENHRGRPHGPRLRAAMKWLVGLVVFWCGAV